MSIQIDGIKDKTYIMHSSLSVEMRLVNSIKVGFEWRLVDLKALMAGEVRIDSESAGQQQQAGWSKKPREFKGKGHLSESALLMNLLIFRTYRRRGRNVNSTLGTYIFKRDI